MQQSRSAAVQEVQQCRSVGNAAVWEVQVQEVPSEWALLRNRQVPKTNNNLKTLLPEHAATQVLSCCSSSSSVPVLPTPLESCWCRAVTLRNCARRG